MNIYNHCLGEIDSLEPLIWVTFTSANSRSISVRVILNQS